MENVDAFSDEERRVLAHLARASEALRGEKLDDAEREVQAALKIRGDDLRARNLHGLIHFRAARYDQAHAVYVELARSHPEDAAIRLNLGLVELRMGRHADAAVNLKKVVELEPENVRAHGYLGIALVRTGDLHGARAAFDRGGQPELKRQVEERIAQSEDAVAARGDLRKAAADGERALEREQPFGAVELEEPLVEARRGGAWQLRVPGEKPPLPGPEGSIDKGGALPLLLEPARPVAAFATARLLSTGNEPFAVAEGGVLMLRVDGRLPTRTWGAIASTGQLTFEPLMRRVRAQATDEPFGEGADAMFVAVGQGMMVVAPRGGKFTLLGLADDIVYVREQAVFSFEESLHWENGRVPGSAPRSDEAARVGDEAARVVQFRGTGRIVVRTQRTTFTLKIEPDSPLFVDGSALLGWIGRVVPRVLHGENGEPTPYVECTGEGVLILEEPPAV
jgi:tetratricopeptide (TPR) repeat protein